LVYQSLIKHKKNGFGHLASPDLMLLIKRRLGAQKHVRRAKYACGMFSEELFCKPHFQSTDNHGEAAAREVCATLPEQSGKDVVKTP